MQVTDECVATMRALLAGESSEYEKLYGRMDQTIKRTAYPALIDAAFFEAVDRRFDEADAASVIEFVGDARSRSEQLQEQIDPSIAERLIRAVLGDGSIDDINDGVRFSTELLVLAVLVADENFDADGLGNFLAGARKTADRWLS